jgi:hypothetical protein
MVRILLVLLLTSLTLSAQTVPARPAFSAYPVKRLYKGSPAPPKCEQQQESACRIIRDGAKSEVQFAGHYTVPQFGLGAGASAFFIVDSLTGKVYNGIGVEDLPYRWVERQSGDQPLRVQFLPTSRLLKINGCPNETDCGYYDYVMVEGRGLKLVQKWLLPKEFQHQSH